MSIQQKSKVDFLLKQGGEVLDESAVIVKKSESIAVIDAWGRTRWLEADKSENTIPAEVLDLLRFMCESWDASNSFAWENMKHLPDGSAGKYPMIQGSKNQSNLVKIGKQPYSAKNLQDAVSWMLDCESKEAPSIAENLKEQASLMRSNAEMMRPILQMGGLRGLKGVSNDSSH